MKEIIFKYYNSINFTFDESKTKPLLQERQLSASGPLHERQLTSQGSQYPLLLKV